MQENAKNEYSEALDHIPFVDIRIQTPRDANQAWAEMERKGFRMAQVQILAEEGNPIVCLVHCNEFGTLTFLLHPETHLRFDTQGNPSFETGHWKTIENTLELLRGKKPNVNPEFVDYFLGYFRTQMKAESGYDKEQIEAIREYLEETIEGLWLEVHVDGVSGFTLGPKEGIPMTLRTPFEEFQEKIDVLLQRLSTNKNLKTVDYKSETVFQFQYTPIPSKHVEFFLEEVPFPKRSQKIKRFRLTFKIELEKAGHSQIKNILFRFIKEKAEES